MGDFAGSVVDQSCDIDVKGDALWLRWKENRCLEVRALRLRYLSCQALGVGVTGDLVAAQSGWHLLVSERSAGGFSGHWMRMDLAHAIPRSDLSSSKYCLAVPGSEYLVLLPTGGSVTVNLSGVTGSRSVEWFNPSNDQTTAGGTVSGGGSVDFTAPFSGMAVLFIHP